jgi:hypothetical protein
MKLDKETLTSLNVALKKQGNGKTIKLEEVFKDLIDLPPPTQNATVK